MICFFDLRDRDARSVMVILIAWFAFVAACAGYFILT